MGYELEFQGPTQPTGAIDGVLFCVRYLTISWLWQPIFCSSIPTLRVSYAYSLCYPGPFLCLDGELVYTR